MNNENNITFKLNSEIKYVEDDMFRDLKKREAKRNNPVTESFKEITDAIENNKIEIGGTGLPIDRYMYMENESNSFSGQDEMIEQGTEKLMDMPMNEMKEFISSKPEEEDEESNESTDVDEKDPTPPEDPEDSNESDDEGTASDSGEDDKIVDNSVDNSTDSTDTEADIDSDERLKSFGQDNSDVQNEYNTKDVDILNKLIASESEAINDYFDGAKDCNNETLRRLYGDIGHEERFHLEQLLYAKSTLTGERYEPRDPDVKREYEELLKMGMDEETAASTAIDKTTINESVDESIDMEELAQEAAVIETMLNQNGILTSYCYDMSQNTLKRNASMTRSSMILMEAFIQEEVTNTGDKSNKDIIKTAKSPYKLLWKGIKTTFHGLIRLSKTIREASAKGAVIFERKMAWLKKHGIKDLFKSNIELFFYDDKHSRYDLDSPVRYVNLLYRLTTDISRKCGVDVGQVKSTNIRNPIPYSKIEDGLAILKKTILTKSRVVVTDANEKTLIKEFFGYTEQKMNGTVKYNGSDQKVKSSANIYDRVDKLLQTTKSYLDDAEKSIVKMEKLEANTNSLYYKNRQLYNELANQMKVVVEYYNKFLTAIAHDLHVIYTFDNGLLKLTRTREQTEAAGGKWEGPDITTNGSTAM